jgi:hypothetical protein
MEHFPWEGDGDPDLHKRMRAIQPTALLCLQRDPQTRPSISELVAFWTMAFECVDNGHGLEAALRKMPR